MTEYLKIVDEDDEVFLVIDDKGNIVFKENIEDNRKKEEDN